VGKCVSTLARHPKVKVIVRRNLRMGGREGRRDGRDEARGSRLCSTLVLSLTCTPSLLPFLSPFRQAVYAMAFDKTGEYIASGALGGSLYVWSVKDGNIVRSFCKLKKDGGKGVRKPCRSSSDFSFLPFYPFPFFYHPPPHFISLSWRWRYFRNCLGSSRRTVGRLLLLRESGRARLPQIALRL